MWLSESFRDISVAAGHWKNCYFLLSHVPHLIHHCLLGSRLSEDILDKKNNLLHHLLGAVEGTMYFLGLAPTEHDRLIQAGRNATSDATLLRAYHEEPRFFQLCIMTRAFPPQTLIVLFLRGSSSSPQDFKAH